MTTEQMDAAFGAAARELKAAKAELNHLIANAMTMKGEVEKLAMAIGKRAKAAELAAGFPANNQDEPLSLSRVDLPFDMTAAKQLDGDISAAVGKVIAAQQQYDRTKP